VSTTVPPPAAGRHGWAELLALVGDLRRLAYDPRSHRTMRCAGSATGSSSTTTRRPTPTDRTDNGPPLLRGAGRSSTGWSRCH
jgi:hypothetical protein